MPKAKRRASIPTFHRATTNVWTVSIWSVVYQCSEKPTTVKEGTYESEQRNPERTGLRSNALCCAIRAPRDKPVVGPSNIEDTTQGLQNIVRKKGKLSHD